LFEGEVRQPARTEGKGMVAMESHAQEPLPGDLALSPSPPDASLRPARRRIRAEPWARLVRLVEEERLDLRQRLRAEQYRALSGALGLAVATVRIYLWQLRRSRGIRGLPDLKPGRPRPGPKRRGSVRARLGETADRLGIDLRYRVLAPDRKRLREELGCREETLRIYLREERRARSLRVEPRPTAPKARKSRARNVGEVPEGVREEGLSALPERKRVALTLRYGLDGEVPRSYGEIGRILGLTAQGANLLVQRTLAALEKPACVSCGPRQPLPEPRMASFEWQGASEGAVVPAARSVEAVMAGQTVGLSAWPEPALAFEALPAALRPCGDRCQRSRGSASGVPPVLEEEQSPR
jgi:hypothetical protein